MPLKLIPGLALCLALPYCALAQSVNADMENESAPPALGGGVPSSSFGAAAGQAGVWNKLYAQSTPPTLLKGLDGALTSITITGPNSGGAHAFNQPLNTGDYRALMNDDRNFSDDTYTFTGLANGRYRFYTYACSPAPGVFGSLVTVSTGSYFETKFVANPCPFNTFVLGKSHSIHEFDVSNGQFSLRLQSTNTTSFFNGFQLVAVPEPTTIALLGIGAPLLWKRRSKRHSA